MDDVHVGMEKDTIGPDEIDKKRPTSFLERCFLRFTGLCNTHYCSLEKPQPRRHGFLNAKFQRGYDRSGTVEDRAALGFDLLLPALARPI